MAGGRGYFWQGLGKSFDGFREQQYKKELADKEQGQSMLEMTSRMNEGIADRGSREKIAGQEHKDRGAALGLSALTGGANAMFDHALGLRKLATELKYNQDAASIKKAADLNSQADVIERQANTALLGLNKPFGVNITPPAARVKKKTLKEELAEMLK